MFLFGLFIVAAILTVIFACLAYAKKYGKDQESTQQNYVIATLACGVTSVILGIVAGYTYYEDRTHGHVSDREIYGSMG